LGNIKQIVTNATAYLMIRQNQGNASDFGFSNPYFALPDLNCGFYYTI
jgi:hypothetical protein